MAGMDPRTAGIGSLPKGMGQLLNAEKNVIQQELTAAQRAMQAAEFGIAEKALHKTHRAINSPVSKAYTLAFFVAPVLAFVGKIPLLGKPFAKLSEWAGLPVHYLMGRDLETGKAVFSVADASSLGSKVTGSAAKGAEFVGKQAGRVSERLGNKITGAAGEVSKASQYIEGKERGFSKALYEQSGAFFGKAADKFEQLFSKPLSFFATRAGGTAAAKTEFANKAMIEKMEALAEKMKNNPNLKEAGIELGKTYRDHLIQLNKGLSVSAAMNETAKKIGDVMGKVAEAAGGENATKELRKEVGEVLKEVSKGIVKPVQKAAKAGATARSISAMPSNLRNLHTSIANMPTGEALQYGALATGTAIGLATTSKNAIQQVRALKALHEDLTGKKHSVLGIFSPTAPEIIKAHRWQLVKQFGPALVIEAVGAVIGLKFVGRGNAGWAATAVSMVTSMGGGMLTSSGILTKNNILPEYVEIAKHQKHGVPVEPALYASLLDKLYPKARELGGAENSTVQAVALWCSEQNLSASAMVKIVQENKIEALGQAILEKQNPLQEVDGLSAMLAKDSKILGTHTDKVMSARKPLITTKNAAIAAGAVGAVAAGVLAKNTDAGKAVIGAATERVNNMRTQAASYMQSAAAGSRV